MTVLPIAVVVGALGHTIENYCRGVFINTSYDESVQQKRESRFMEELELSKVDHFPSLKEKKFVPKTIFEKNVSPNLLDENEQGR